jgi:diguanylate cyclase (GGDEF)-like protein
VVASDQWLSAVRAGARVVTGSVGIDSVAADAGVADAAHDTPIEHYGEPPAAEAGVRRYNDWALVELLRGLKTLGQFIDDLPRLSQFTVDLATRELRSSRTSLMVLENAKLLRILAARGVPDGVVANTIVRVGEGIAGRVASLGKPMLVDAHAASGEHSDRNYRSDSFISVPVNGDRRVVGVVNVTEPSRRSSFEAHDLEMLVNIADSVGSVFHHALRYREIEELAVRDDLTGLYNRRYLWEFLDAILDRAREQDFPVTLLLFDIDHFKRYNDQFGHPAGDQVLREVATLMRQNFRTHDVVCRLGGEEFAVVLWDGRGQQAGSGWQGYPTTAFAFAERLREATMRHRFGAVNCDGITLSGGLATFPWDGVSRTELLERADEALYRAKRDGRNRVYLYGQSQAS